MGASTDGHLWGARLCSSPSTVSSGGVWSPLKVARGCAYGLSYSLRNSWFPGATLFPMTTDNGPQFVSSEFSSYLAARGIAHICTAFYHPQANGGVKRFNQSLKNGIRAHFAQGFPFKADLSQTLLHYRAIQHATTGCPLPVSCLAGN